MVLRQAGVVCRRGTQGRYDHVPAVTPIRAGEEVVETRSGVLMFDPLLWLAAAGLIACSLITLKGATRTADPGHPLFYVERQGLYAAVGLVTRC